MRDVEIWSVAVPTVNILFRLSDWLVRRSAEAAKIGQSQREQTQTSGLRDIPWKTVFPSWVGVILKPDHPLSAFRHSAHLLPDGLRLDLARLRTGGREGIEQSKMQEIDSLPAWGAGISGLRKAADNFWELDTVADVSFPESGHSALVEIEQDSYWFNHRNDIIAAAVRQFPPDGPVFDIGGGNGYVSVGLKRAGFDCVVIEPGPAGAANAAARGFQVIRAPFQDLAVSDSTLAAAGMFDVLEHIEDDAAALAKLFIGC